MEFEKKCFGLKTPNISSNATCQDRWKQAAGMSKPECETNKHILGLIPTLVSDRGTKAVYALK